MIADIFFLKILTDISPDLKVLAVSKGRTTAEILHLLEKTGLTRIGESRLKEAEEKFPQLPKEIEKHYLGKLQSRKIHDIVKRFDCIQTVENLEQAKLISKSANSLQKNPYPIFIEVNLSELPQRSGVSVADFHGLLQEISQIQNLEIRGVMGLATDRSKAAQEFQLLKALQGPLPECSMGMSEDYDLAIEKGSTMLRLGRILFENA